MRWGKHPPTTALYEACESLGRAPDTVLHFTADTGPILRTRTPSIVTVHGIASRWIDGVRRKPAEKVWRTRVSRAISSADAVVTVSASSAKDVAAVFNIDEKAINVIPHGIDYERFSRPSGLSLQAGSAVPREFMLYIGNIEPRKNVDALCEAFSSQIVQNLGIQLVIAGRPAWAYGQTMQRISNTPGIIYLGEVSDEDVVALLQRAKLFVFPSRYEGFGFPVLEAMASGCPVLTTRRGALNEVAGPAATVDDLDPEAIAEGIVACLADEEWLDATSRSGRLWAQDFSWDRSVESHLELYKQVLR
ncbi:glycosyltransferase family 4 protein [Gordonia sp. UBA7860]|uniref:glycosyltransferase family 4 protein n=1 Tax=Gordonia sp. UBA7860 TaxID=1946579 RepID=UPI00257C18D0|nr:glycosyltransferase family 1 protein [Gordonia sp. UBA7860]